MPETKKKSAATSTTRRATTAKATTKPAAKSTTKATAKTAAKPAAKATTKAKPKAPARTKPAGDEAEATPRKRAIAGAAAAVKALRGAAPPGEAKARKKKSAAPVELPETDGVTKRREAAQSLALKAAAAGLEKKAERIEIIDVGEKVDYTDFLVLMSGRSDRQVKSVAEGILAAVEELGVRAQQVEGLSQGHWVLVDLGDVIVHVFLDEARSYYDLEGFWIDAKRVPVEGAAADGPPRA